MPGEPVREIVAGVDDPPDPAAVLDLASDEAVLRSAPLTLVHVSAGTRSSVLSSAVARVRAARPALPVRAEPLGGDPAATLAARAAGAGLLVLGHRRGRRAGRHDPRAVAAAVLGSATVPVLICPDSAVPGGPVVVGVDGTAGSEAALRFGFAEADLRRAPLTAMHLWPPLGAASPDRGGVSAAEGLFLDLLATWSDKYPDVPVRLSVRHGLDAAIVLSAASRSARLMVVSGATFNPVLAALTARAACPVAVVPDDRLVKAVRAV
ncbi:universal stress protein [Phytohabitans suffuscus]|uniref:universal stress protein n=1 Tax=Phytohabitans suffuscus TaxID=624315 RepID=UPI00156475CA|nr:universal stress protein [Phytohabitans suffuscus]